MSEFTIAKAFIELGVKGEAVVQERLNKQKLEVDRLQKSIASGAFEAQVKQQNAVNAAMERTKAEAQKIVNRNLPAQDVLPADKKPSAIGNLFSTIASKFTAGAEGGIGQVFGTVLGMTGKLGAAFKGAAAAAGPVGIAVAVAATALEKVGEVAVAFFNKAMSLAAAANPVAAERFQYAQRDLAAVMGRVFVPILEKATEVVRFFADVLNAILPSTNEVREAFKGFDPVFAQVKQIAADLAPLFKSFISYHLKQMAVAIQIVAKEVERLIEIAKMMPGAKLLLDTGRAMGGGTLPSSHGAGDFRTPSMTGIAEAKNAFLIEALRVSAGERKDEPTGTEQKRQTQLLERMAGGANLGANVGGLIPGGSAVGAVTGAVVGVLGF